MDYRNVVRDFAERTQKNLEAIEKLQQEQPDGEIYEVTQLVNSMLGLLVFPQQRYINSIPETPLADLANQGWRVPVTIGEYPDVKTLRELVRYMRNAIAHFNIKFIADDVSHQIAGLHLWNMRRGEKTWETKLKLEDLREITERFIELILEETDDQQASFL
jgi:hypothetical protein